MRKLIIAAASAATVGALSLTAAAQAQALPTNTASARATAVSKTVVAGIPAHSTLAMRPNGIHMVITGAGQMRGGKDITLTLVFARAGQVSVIAQVTNPQSGGSSYFLN